MQHVVRAVSYTTRQPRLGEKEGKDYCFVSTKTFETLIEQDGFVEYAKVFDHYYGTPKSLIESSLSKGIDVLLDIDWQGAAQLKALPYPQMSLFILPPSLEILRARLEGRGQDSQDVIERRMAQATQEIQHYIDYEYIVINEQWDRALAECETLIEASRLSRDIQVSRYQDAFTSLLG